MAMKRLPRQPEKFDALELYSAMSRQLGYKVGVDGDIEDFQARVATSLKAALESPTMLHGKRVEAMFAHVLGALGSCRLVKQEDSGTAYASSEEFEIPDYRVVTSEGVLLLIEVKNFHMKNLNSRFKIKRSYIRKLKEYADLNRAELKFAVYFSRINKWVLLSPESFFDQGRYAWIDLPHGVARNEMSKLGDRMIATLPPLSLELIGSQQDERATVQEDGSIIFTALEVRMKCAGKNIRSDAEKNIAFYLMRHGNWDKIETPAKIVDGKVVAIEFVVSSDEPQGDHPFRMLGDLSSMVSSAFREITVSDEGIVSLDVKFDPSFFQVAITHDYKGEDLPLWQFAIQPNLDLMDKRVEHKS